MKLTIHIFLLFTNPVPRCLCLVLKHLILINKCWAAKKQFIIPKQTFLLPCTNCVLVISTRVRAGHRPDFTVRITPVHVLPSLRVPLSMYARTYRVGRAFSKITLGCHLMEIVPVGQKRRARPYPSQSRRERPSEEETCSCRASSPN